MPHFYRLERSYGNDANLGKALSDDAFMKQMWEYWMHDYEPDYPTEEERQLRFQNFKQIVAFVHANNTSPSPQHEGIGIGVFADLALDEPCCNCCNNCISEDEEEDDSNKEVKADAEDEEDGSNKRVKTDAD